MKVSPPAWGTFNIIHLYYIVLLKELSKRFNCIPVIILFKWKLKIDNESISDRTLDAWTKNYKKILNKIIGKCIIKSESDFKGISFDCLRLIKDLDPPIYNGYYRGLEIYIFHQITTKKMRNYACLVVGGEDQRNIWDKLHNRMIEQENIDIIHAFMPLIKDERGQKVSILNHDLLPSPSDDLEKIKDKMNKWKFDVKDHSNLWSYLIKIVILHRGSINFTLDGSTHNLNNFKNIDQTIAAIGTDTFKEKIINECYTIFKEL